MQDAGIFQQQKKHLKLTAHALSGPLSAAAPPDPPLRVLTLSDPPLISYSHSLRNGLAGWPRDINMQIVVDNNAKPHNQQIVNPPNNPNTRTHIHTHTHSWLPAHASSTCGKKLSCMLQNIRPPPCCEAGDWLQRQRTPTRSLASDLIFRGTDGNMSGPKYGWWFERMQTE